MVSSETLTDRTTRAAQWRMSASVAGAASQLTIGVVLARRLAPADFGVMALALVVTGFARPVSDLGIGSALVQRVDLTDRHIRCGFTLSLLTGAALATGLALIAPLGAALAGEPAIAPVLRWLSIGFVIQGASVVANALLVRHLDFKRLFFIEISSYVVGYGGVSIGLALLGYGVWSLVWGNLVQAAIVSTALLIVSRHPIAPLLALRELRDLFGFGFGAATNGFVNYIALNADNFIVGRWLGAAPLGLYARAYSLMNLPCTYAATVLSSVFFPGLARLQHEPERLRRAYLALTQLTALAAAPSMATLAIAGPHLVPAIYGSRWAGVVAPLQILCVAGYFRAQYHLGALVARSVGRVYGELLRQAIYAALVIIGTLIGARAGLPAVAVGVGVAILYMFVGIGQLALRITQTPWGTYLRAQAGGLCTALITASVALPLRILLEARGVPSVVTAVVVSGVALVPWSIGTLWTLGDPRYGHLRSRLPGWCRRLIAAVRSVGVADLYPTAP